MEEKEIVCEKAEKPRQSDQWGFIKWVVKSLLAIIVVLIALLFVSNMAWPYVLQCYDHTVTTVYEQCGTHFIHPLSTGIIAQKEAHMTRQDFRGFYKSQHPDGGLFVDLATLSRIMGMDAKHMRQIICELGIEYYRPAARKLYNVEDVFVQVSQTRYRQ